MAPRGKTARRLPSPWWPPPPLPPSWLAAPSLAAPSLAAPSLAAPSLAKYSAVSKTRRHVPGGSFCGPRPEARPSYPVRVRAISVRPAPETCSSQARTPAAGAPRAAASTCVVTALILRFPARSRRGSRSRVHPLPHPALVDLPELAPHHVPLGARVVAQPLPEQGQQLRSAAPGRAHQVDVAEPLLVSSVAARQRLDRGLVRGLNSGLLLP